MLLDNDINIVVVDTDAKFLSMLDRLDRERVFAVDTETVGKESLELFEQAEAKKVDLLKAALRHCEKFPRLSPQDPPRIATRGAKKSLNEVLKVRKDIDKLLKKAQSSISGLQYWNNYTANVQIGLEDNTCYMIRPIPLVPGQKISEELWEQLGKLLNRSRNTLLLHNAKFDIRQMYYHLNILLDGRLIFDTQIGRWLLTNGLEPKKAKSLKACVKDYLDYDMDKDVSVRVSNWLLPWSPKQLKYAAKDVLLLFPLWKAIRKELQSWQLMTAMRIRCEFSTVAAIMDMSGYPIDIEGFKEYKEELEKKLKYIDLDIRTQGQCDDSFNPNSPSQVFDLFAKFGINVDDTNEKTLKKSEYSDHPIIAAILDYRGIARELSTVNTYIEWNRNGRMYSEFRISDTTTGRLASGNSNEVWKKKDPWIINGQNAPKGRFRSYIKTPPGKKLIVADYSQVEIRWCAFFSRDPAMIEAYRNGEDLHKITAISISKINEADFDALDPIKKKEIRDKAKPPNFTLIFGGGAETLKNYAKIDYDVIYTIEEANEIKRAWHNKFSNVRVWHRKNDWECQENKMVRTASGLIRHFPEPNFNEHQNTKIQGSAGDGGLNGLNVFFYNAIDDGYVPLKDFWLPGMVHDENLVEVEERLVEDFSIRLQEGMIIGMQEFLTDIPVEADLKVADNWDAAK
jgi:DNA polymerase-1